MTHDYKRHGTTTLFAALSVLDGTVIGRCMQPHRHSEFIRFLNAIERDVPAGKLIHAVLDNYATHKHPKVSAWLSRHPRWTFHFTPNFGLLAQRGRKLLLQDDPPTYPARCLLLNRRFPGRHQRLSGRAQCQPQTLRLDQSADAILAKLHRSCIN
jgi:DDE superfamily endonuclease